MSSLMTNEKNLGSGTFLRFSLPALRERCKELDEAIILKIHDIQVEACVLLFSMIIYSKIRQ